MKKYVFASLGKLESLGIRIGGAGLGNMLFTWAKSIVYAKNNNLIFIPPTWSSLKIGPMLRGEFDKRFYNNLFKSDHSFSVFKKFWVLNFKRKEVQVFQGMEGLFNDFLNEHQFIKTKILDITGEEHLKNIKDFSGDGISIHIRMGDFYPFTNEKELREGKWNTQLPLKWYISQIEKIRNETNKDIPVYIFSDATDEELLKVLELPNTHREFFGSAIADMLALSKSKVLIASGSTFSSWASFLGQNHTIWFPGQQRMRLVESDEKFDGELDYDTPVPSFIKAEFDV